MSARDEFDKIMQSLRNEIWEISRRAEFLETQEKVYERSIAEFDRLEAELVEVRGEFKTTLDFANQYHDELVTLRARVAQLEAAARQASYIRTVTRPGPEELGRIAAQGWNAGSLGLEASRWETAAAAVADAVLGEAKQ